MAGLSYHFNTLYVLILFDSILHSLLLIVTSVMRPTTMTTINTLKTETRKAGKMTLTLIPFLNTTLRPPVFVANLLAMIPNETKAMIQMMTTLKTTNRH